MNLPSEGDLSRLNPRACMAYAVRCAMRVRPLYRSRTDNPQAEQHQVSVDRAISIASQHAWNSFDSSFTLAAAVAVAKAAYDAARAAANVAAAAAANAAANAAAVNIPVRAAAAAYDAAYDAARAAYATSDDFDAVTAAAIHDYRNLLRLNPSSIDPSENGPLGHLWPNGEPLWYARAKAEQQSTDVGQSIEVSSESKLEFSSSAAIQLTPPPLKIYIDPGDAPQDLITELYTTLDALYRAQGGSGLQFTKDEQRSFSIEEAPL